MVNRDNILDVYSKGDMSRRLFMYMEYRDLRDQFMEIEQAEGEKIPSPCFDAKKVTEPSPLKRWLYWLRSSFAGTCLHTPNSR